MKFLSFVEKLSIEFEIISTVLAAELLNNNKHYIQKLVATVGENIITTIKM